MQNPAIIQIKLKSRDLVQFKMFAWYVADIRLIPNTIYGHLNTDRNDLWNGAQSRPNLTD